MDERLSLTVQIPDLAKAAASFICQSDRESCSKYVPNWSTESSGGWKFVSGSLDTTSGVVAIFVCQSLEGMAQLAQTDSASERRSATIGMSNIHFSF